MRRLRITFAKDDEIKYISHLDLARAWERTLRRANVPLAYSKGFSPHPRLSVAVPLPVGFTSEAELLDVVEDDDLSPDQVRQMIEAQIPPGLRIVDVMEVPLGESSPQARLMFTEYRVDLVTPLSKEEVERRVASFMAADSIERQRRRAPDKEKHRARAGQGGKPRTYNLRSVVEDVRLEERVDAPRAEADAPVGSRMRLLLRLKAGGADGTSEGNAPAGMGRPDEVLEALGLDDCAERITRKRIELR
ncbi:MAG: DUF2344 domain-containing protein [Chloroflexi bacterium]|nr:DUF2344 domain-containing protein [Chloroflexota bacterium]